MQAKTNASPVQEWQRQNSDRSFAFLPWISLPQIQLNPPMFLYALSIRFIADYVKRLQLNAKKYLLSRASLNWMNPILVLVVFEENVDVVHQEKTLYLDYSDEMGMYIQKIVPDCSKATLQGIIRRTY